MATKDWVRKNRNQDLMTALACLCASWTLIVIVIGVLLFAPEIHAQQVPDAGSVLYPIEQEGRTRELSTFSAPTYLPMDPVEEKVVSSESALVVSLSSSKVIRTLPNLNSNRSWLIICSVL